MNCLQSWKAEKHAENFNHTYSGVDNAGIFKMDFRLSGLFLMQRSQDILPEAVTSNICSLP